MMVRLLFYGLLVPLFVLAQSVGLPQPYSVLLTELLGKNRKVDVSYLGGNFKGIIERRTPEGFLRIEVSDDDFLSFSRQLYEVVKGKEPEKVSIKVVLPSGTLPYNPFYQLWDENYNVRILKFSKLKPGCRGEVITLKAKKVSGARVEIPYGEVKKFFIGDFKYPSFYCF